MSKERVKFVLEWERRWNDGEGDLNFAALCREFGVSRQQGYMWIARFRDARNDVRVVAEARSRRPHTTPTKVSDELEELLVATRKAHPTWGPKKLRAWLLHRRCELELPAVSTIGEVLKRRGLTSSRHRRMRVTRETRQPFAKVTGPNATWCVDFKGHFRTGDGMVCYPLTIVDAYSRLLVRCEAVREPAGDEVQRVFDSAFQEYGLPSAIRSDNGPPFASSGAGGLTPLSVWWLRLGIRVERIRPGKPQENGRQERMHRTLKEETARPPRATVRAQQRAFDEFRREYNEERPHEALGLQTPASHYQASSRRYPRPLVRFSPAAWDHPARVDPRGYITWNRTRLFVSSALAHEDVELRYEAERDFWDVVFGPLSIGKLRETSTGCRFEPSRGRMQDAREVSGMSLE